MDIAVAQQFLREHENAVLATWRRDGRLQMSPVTVGLMPPGGPSSARSRNHLQGPGEFRAIRAPRCASSSRLFAACGSRWRARPRS